MLHLCQQRVEVIILLALGFDGAVDFSEIAVDDRVGVQEQYCMPLLALWPRPESIERINAVVAGRMLSFSTKGPFAQASNFVVLLYFRISLKQQLTAPLRQHLELLMPWLGK